MSEIVKTYPPQRKWKTVITNRRKLLTLNVRELWEYRDLLLIWMRRDILSIYKQTILGPVWFVLQPLLTMGIYVVFFSRVAKFSTVGLPAPLFYLTGIILWNYFSECITKTATFFKDGSPIFSKVYFPRLIVPLSLVLTNLVKFSIQFALFLLIYAWFLFTGSHFHPTMHLLLLPVLVLIIAALGFGSGLIVSSLTTRYKDLVHLITFGVQLMMFTAPVFLPLSTVHAPVFRKVFLANPMTGVIEAFRFGFTGAGTFSWDLLAYDGGCALFLLLAGIFVYNSVERDFVDTI